MGIRKKRFGVAVAFLLIAGAAVGWDRWHWAANQDPPQVITLANGDKYRFVGANYGTKWVPPSLAAELFGMLPTNLANLTGKYLGQGITQYRRARSFAMPRLFLWFRPVEVNAGSTSPNTLYGAALADQAGNEAGGKSQAAFSRGAAWVCVSFPVIPRRSEMLQCNFYPFGGTAGGITNAVASIRFHNPLFANYPQWQPEPIPAVKNSGDLEVRLDSISRGSYANLFGPIPTTYFNASARSTGGVADDWDLFGYDLSDATGNALHVYKTVQAYRWRSADADTISASFLGTLWPDESAWRLKLDFVRTSGFRPDELVTFKNVPIPAMGTTTLFHLTETAGGIQVVLTQFAHRSALAGPTIATTAPPPPEILLELPGKPERVAIYFHDVTTDAGDMLLSSYGHTESGYTLFLTSIPTNAHTVDITFAVQKTRTVEFLVKPPRE